MDQGQGGSLSVRFEGRQLVVLGGDETTLTIGRDPAAELVTDDGRISRRHAVLRFGASGWEIEDLGSTNGTFLNGQRINRAPIAGSMQFRLGDADAGATLDLTAVAPRAPMATVVVRPGAAAPAATMAVPPVRAAAPAPPPIPMRPQRPHAPSSLGRLSAVNKLVHNLDWLEGDDTDDDPTR